MKEKKLVDDDAIPMIYIRAQDLVDGSEEWNGVDQLPTITHAQATEWLSNPDNVEHLRELFMEDGFVSETWVETIRQVANLIKQRHEKGE